jgi:hypothetical protein
VRRGPVRPLRTLAGVDIVFCRRILGLRCNDRILFGTTPLINTRAALQPFVSLASSARLLKYFEAFFTSKRL